MSDTILFLIGLGGGWVIGQLILIAYFTVRDRATGTFDTTVDTTAADAAYREANAINAAIRRPV